MKAKEDKEFINTMSRDQGNWKGPFYYNKKDPRILVPKLNPSLGWTVNFASPYAYLAIAALTGIVIVAYLISR
jgi:uncharacterized membrane protein